MTLADTGKAVVIKNNEITSQLILNWNGPNVTVVDNRIGDLRVNQNVKRTGAGLEEALEAAVVDEPAVVLGELVTDAGREALSKAVSGWWLRAEPIPPGTDYRFSVDGGDNPYSIQHDLQQSMNDLVGIIRTESELREALATIEELKQRASDAVAAG